MPNYPSDRPSACCPYLFYDDVEAAIRFLTTAFGLSERFVDREEGGRAHHAQLAHQSSVIMLGETGAHAGYRARKSPVSAGSINAGVYLFVDDVDAHAKRAREAGASIVMEPTTMHWGERLYCAEDPEGQFWMFAKPVG
jgi:PhnB protein